MGKPTSNRVLIKLDKVLENSSPIIVATNKKEKPQTGVIVEIGPDVLFCKKGNKVQISATGGTPVTDEMVTVREDEIYYNFSL